MNIRNMGPEYLRITEAPKVRSALLKGWDRDPREGDAGGERQTLGHSVDVLIHPQRLHVIHQVARCWANHSEGGVPNSHLARGKVPELNQEIIPFHSAHN